MILADTLNPSKRASLIIVQKYFEPPKNNAYININIFIFFTAPKIMLQIFEIKIRNIVVFSLHEISML